MFEFGDSFKRIMGEQGYSVSSFSKLTGLDRGWLYAIFAGKRKIPEQTLQKILTGSFFTQENSQQLRRAFYEEVYGSDQMERILYLQDHFQEFRHPASPAPTELPPMAGHVPDSGFLATQSELFGAAYRLIRQAPKDAASNQVYTNLPFRFTQLNDLLFYTLQNYQPSYDLYRILPMQQNDSGTHNLEVLFSALQYLDKKAHLYYYYTPQLHHQQIDQLFPYYLASPQAVLLIHQNGEQGQLILDQGFCGQIKESFFAALEHCSQMTYSYQSALSFLTTGHEMRSTDYTVELGNTFTMLLNQDLLQRYGSPRFTGVSRIGVIHSLLRFLNQQSSNSQDNFMVLSRQNILDFLSTGTFPNIPRDYLKPLSMEDRLALLQSMETHLQNHPLQSLGILDERFFGEYRNEYSISLARQSNSVIICGQKQPVTGQSFVGECGLQISNAVLYNDFVNFFDYAKRNQYIYDTENSLSILRELALGYSQPNLFAKQPQTAQPAAETIPPSGEKIPAI